MKYIVGIRMGFGMHKRKLSFAIILAMLLPMMMVLLIPGNVTAVSSGQSQVSWISATLDTTSQAGSSVSVAIDSEGYVHASYYAEADALRAIMYVTNAGGTWTTQRVDSGSGMGSYNSIAIDADGNPWIVYYDSPNGDLRYARMTSDGSWEKGLVDSDSDVGKYNDIAFSPNGEPAVSYYDTSEKLKVAIYSDGSFEPEFVGDMSVGATSIAFFSDGRPAVVFLDRTTTYPTCAIKSDDTWSSEPIESTPAGSASSAVMTSGDNLLVTYVSTATGMLRFAELEGGNWTSSNLLVSVGPTSSKSMAVDPSGNAYITYYSINDSSLVYLNNAKGWWESKVLDTKDEAGVVNAVGVNDIGRISVVYTDSSEDSSNLKYITNDMATWSVYSIDAFGNDNGKSNDMTIDSYGITHIAYYNETDNSLFYTTNKNGAFETVIVDDNAGENPSIAVDEAGVVHISYYDPVGKHLRYASNENGAWLTSTVDPSNNVGFRSAIIVDGAGNVTIVYTQDELKNLKYVVGKDYDWQGLLNLDGSGLVDTESGPSLAYDSSGVLHVSYIKSQDLYHVQRTITDWSVPVLIDNGVDCDGDTDIACSDQGQIFISYHAISSTKGLRLATYDGSWTTEWVVESGSYDQAVWNSITVDKLGQPQIAFSGPDGKSLEFRVWHGSLWQTSQVYHLDIGGIVTSAVAPSGAVQIAYYDEDESTFRVAMQIVKPSQPVVSALVDGNSIRISWTAPEWNGGSAISGYSVLRGTSVDDLKEVALVPASSHSYNDTDVDSGSTYYYAVKAVNSEGIGDISTVQMVETQEDATSNNVDLTLLIIVAVILVAVIAVAFFVLSRRRR